MNLRVCSYFNFEKSVVLKNYNVLIVSLSFYISFIHQSMSWEESKWKIGSRERINTRYVLYSLGWIRRLELNAKNFRASLSHCSWNGNATQYRERSDLYLAISWLGQIYKWGRGIRYIFRSLPRLHQVSSSLNAHLVALSMVDLLFALQDKIKIFCEFFLTEINLFH